MATINTSGWFVESALATASCIAIVVNLLVIFIFIRRPGLRTVSNRFVLNLLVTNLISSTILIPLLLADEITKRTAPPKGFVHPSEIEVTTSELFQNDGDDIIILTDTNNDYIIQNGRDDDELSENLTSLVTNYTSARNDFAYLWKNCSPLCYIAEGFTSLVCTASILSILLIAVDQYFAVVHPLRYHMRIDQCKSLILIATSWITSILFGILGAITPSKDDSLWNFCKQSDDLTYVTQTLNNFSGYLRIAYTILYFFLVILVPFLAICMIYLCIYSAAHRNSERMRHTNSGSITINLEAYVPVPMMGGGATDDETKSDITEDGLMLKLDEQTNYFHKQSLETLAEAPQVTIENWDENCERKEMKKVHSVPVFNTTIESSLSHHKSPTIENIPEIFVNKSSTPNLRKLSIFDTNYFRRKSTTSDSMPITPIGTPKQRAGSLKSTHSFMNTLKCRISNASLFRYREETRAAKISVIVIVMVLVCYIPYGIALILHITTFNSNTLAIFDSISLVHLVFSSVISPFLFAYRNRRIKREIRKIFHPTKLDADLQRLKSKVNKNTIRQFGNNVTQITTKANTTFLQINNEHFNPNIVQKMNNNICNHHQVIVDEECKSILKRVCDKTKMWNTTKKTCNFMTVPNVVDPQTTTLQTALNTECRSSFSSQNSSTQMSTVSTDS